MRDLNPRPMGYLFLFYNLRTIQQLTMLIIIMYVVYLHDCESTEEKINILRCYTNSPHKQRYNKLTVLTSSI